MKERIGNPRVSDGLLRLIVIVCAILMALLVGSILIVIEGESITSVYYYLFVQPFSSVNGILKVLAKTTPYIFVGLAVAVAFRCNVFNIGVEGQLYIGALAAAAVGYFVRGVPPWLHVGLCFCAAMAAGALLALIPAWLKVTFNVHEVISTIMLNYIASALIALTVNKFFRDTGEISRTPTIMETARIHQFRAPIQFNTAIWLALFLCVAIYILLNRTALGWRIDAAGKNLQAAAYSGISAKQTIIAAMLLSGALAGLTGAERVCGAFGYMEVNFSPGYGYDAIAIAIIANNNPFGVLIVSFMMGLLSYGGLNINMMTSIASEWVNVLSGLIFIFVVAGNALIALLPTLREKRRSRREAN